MKVNIILIGNSRGIRIPKALLEQCDFSNTVEIAIDNSRLIFSSAMRNRVGWDDAFKTMATKHDDKLLDSAPTEFDESEWQW